MYLSNTKSFVFAGLVILLMISIIATSNWEKNSVNNISSNETFINQLNLDLDSILNENFNSLEKETSESDIILINYNDELMKDTFLSELNAIDYIDILEFENLPFFVIKSSTEVINQFKTFNLQSFGLKTYDNTKYELADFEINQEFFDLSKIAAEGEPYIVDGVGASNLVSEGIDGEGIKLAILDTGIYENHPDLSVFDSKSFVTTEYGFDDNETASDLAGHGTHVAGIASGSGYGYNMFRGVAPGVDLYNIKVLDQFGVSYGPSLLGGINYAISQKMDIISLSLGYDYNNPLDPISIAIDTATESGIVCIVSAGNSGSNYRTIGTPGSSKSAITVGASDYDKNIASYSSRGPSNGNMPDPDIVAPGTQIVSALAKNSWTDEGLSIIEPNQIFAGNHGAEYITSSGTSMSAPMVAGVASLLLQKHSTATPLQIRAALQNSAMDLGYDDMVQGFGLVDADSASEYLINQISAQNILSVSPKENFFLINDSTIIIEEGEEFNKPTIFPGEEIKTTISVVSPYADNYPTSIELIGNASEFIDVTSTIPNEEPNSVSLIPISLKIPYNITAGEYSAIIKVKNSKQEIEIPVGPFNVKYPISRIYWDNFHSLKSSTLNNSYLAFETIVRHSQIQIVEYTSPITSFNLSSFSTLIIPNIFIPLGDNEVESINKFLNQGNNLILLADIPHLSLITEYNQLLSNYGMNFTDALVEYNDIGWDLGISDMNLQVTVESPLIDSGPLNLTNTWSGGTVIEVVNDTDSELSAVVSNDGVDYGAIGVFPGNISHNEKIIAIGDNQILAGQKITGNFIILYEKIIDFLKDDDSVNVAMIKENIDNELNIYGYITDITGYPEHNVSWVINNSIRFPNSTIIEDIELNFYLEGRFSIIINCEENGIYEFTANINMENNSVINLKELNVKPLVSEKYTEYRNSHLYELSPEGFLLSRDASTLSIYLGTEVNPNIDYYTITGAISQLPVLQFNDIGTMKIEVLNSMKIEFSETNPSSNFTASWEIPSNIRAGYYTLQYEIIGFDDQDQVLKSRYYYLIFELDNEIPTFDKELSTIGDEFLNSYNPNSLYESWGLGDVIEFSIKGNDDRENSECFVAFLSLEFFNGVYPEFLDLIELSKEDDYWNGNYTLPSSRTIPLEKHGIAIKAESDQIFLFLIILRDSDGYYSISQISFSIEGSLIDTAEIMQIFFIIFIPTSTIIGISVYYYSKKKKITDKDPYSYIQNNLVRKQQNMQDKRQIGIPTVHPKFCGICGSKISPGVKFCTKCGSKLITLDDLGIKDIDYET